MTKVINIEEARIKLVAYRLNKLLLILRSSATREEKIKMIKKLAKESR